MLYQLLSNSLRDRGDLPAIVHGGDTFSYRTILNDAASMRLEVFGRIPAGVYMRNGPGLITAIIALDAAGRDAYLIPSEMPEKKAGELLEAFKIPSLLGDKPGPENWTPPSCPTDMENPRTSQSRESKVVIFTSGTTGTPKGAAHTWRSLSAGIRIDPKYKGTNWLLTYGLTRFAGLQVFLHAFLNGGCLVIPSSNDIEELARLIEEHKIENVSGTPTFWRKFLTAIPSEKLASLPLKQITLGGEIVGQAILTALRTAFPVAQITHIYASTEAGVCFSVRDGKEGFPVEYLEENPARPALRIEEGELFIRSKHAMSGYVGQENNSEWFPSGDLVEVRDDRVYFLGRKSDIINVGGSKVYPAEVEEEIKKVPGVANVRVYGQRSSFAGQLVRAEVVASSGVSTQELKANIIKRCSEALAVYKRPRLIDFVPALEENESRKIVRPKTNEQ